jgi:hypothetical protein
MVESLLLVGATQGEPRCEARFFHHVPGRQHYPKSSAGSADADRNDSRTSHPIEDARPRVILRGHVEHELCESHPTNCGMEEHDLV